MVLLNLKDQRDIVKVIEYLVEIHQKNNTVGDVMKRFGITADEYRMCSNLAIPAIAQGNLKGRYKAVSRSNKAMRADIRAAYEATMDEEGPAAEALRMLYETHCVHKQNVTFGTADGASEE